MSDSNEEAARTATEQLRSHQRETATRAATRACRRLRHDGEVTRREMVVVHACARRLAARLYQSPLRQLTTDTVPATDSVAQLLDETGDSQSATAESR